MANRKAGSDSVIAPAKAIGPLGPISPIGPILRPPPPPPTRHDCEDWHDTLDWAYLSTDENFDPPDERFVSTSWHAKEPLDDAVFFFWSCGLIDRAAPLRTGIFLLGDSPDIRPALKAAVASEAPKATLLIA